MEQGRDHERQAKEKHLTAEQDDKVPPLRPGDTVLTHCPSDQISKIVEKLPLVRNKTVEYPHVEVLEPVYTIERLVRRQTPQRSDIDVVVGPHNVRVVMVEDIVLPSPQVRAPAQHI